MVTVTERFYLRAAAQMLAAERDKALVVTPPSVTEWAAANATIVLPGLGVQRFVPHPYQAALLDDHSPRRLVLKARQTGLSTAIALEALYYALHRPHDRALIVSRNENLAGLLVQYVQVAIAGMASPPKLERESQSKLVFENGSEIVSLPANPATGRGYPASRVYLDEAAFLQHDELIMQGILPTLASDGQMTMLSTPRGRHNAFFRYWSGVEGAGWSKHVVTWSDCPRYTPEWAEQQRASMTTQAWAEEYGCDFLASGDAVFDPDDLAQCKVGHIASPIGCDEYLHAWDIGRRRDHTVGLTFGRRGEVWHLVDTSRALEPYPVTQRRIEDRQTTYGGRSLVESNGVGDPVIENLLVAVEPFTTTVRTKTQAIQALQLLIQQGKLKFDYEPLERELSLYAWDDRALVQDCVMAAAIASSQMVPQPNPYAGAIGNTISNGWADEVPAEKIVNPDGIEHWRRSPYGDRDDGSGYVPRSNGAWGWG